MLDKNLFSKSNRLIAYSAKVWRMVETQETTATLGIVDSMEEQALLEELLDQVKPPYREGTQGMHYLFRTAFRYPPLRYGSRFGTRLMPSFFYACETPRTALAETAYYRFVFLSDMQNPYPEQIDSQHTLFSASVRTDKCLDLCAKKYSTLRAKITDPQHYSYCQAIGEWAINQKGAELIRAESVRLRHVSNVVISEPKVIRSKSPISSQTWLCRTSNDKISFSSRDAVSLHSFLLEDFCVNGVLPRPA